MSMDKKLTAAVYAAVEKAYDHQCDIEDAADEILEIIEADRQRRGEPVAWLYEDELPDNYPYDTMFPYSKVDGVRMFPVYAPQPAEPTKAPSEDERAAQGLPPYNPRKPTEEEWARLTENGRKAWGGPVKAGRDGQATMLTELSKIERGIRSLIPKEPPCET